MIHIAQFAIWRIGPYTVRQGLRQDNPAFAQYIVFRDARLIGKSFSRPDESCCRWLEITHGVYATESATFKKWRMRRPGRPRKSESARDLEEALAA